ncbi:hypothetical protein QJS04_geneDACA023474 [Acorus gramineus]|uniref:Yippee domain-containing protein n=1 Tax=Acorus gramineus TaxID=55184 RepID=A0AAV9B3U5_ACOGR|nr:hypothetical protein QJS04_geneDACA023474 [Acorus gramineus]
MATDSNHLHMDLGCRFCGHTIGSIKHQRCSVIQGPDGYKVHAFNIPVDVHVSIFTVERAVMDHGYIMSDLRCCKCHARLGWTREPYEPSVTKRGRFKVSSYHSILVDSKSSDMGLSMPTVTKRGRFMVKKIPPILDCSTSSNMVPDQSDEIETSVKWKYIIEENAVYTFMRHVQDEKLFP